MNPLQRIDDIAHVIQLAVAPVFLLTAVGTVLAVLTNRLGRSVDRRRVLAAYLLTADAPLAAEARAELELVERRVHLIYGAIVSAVLCAIFVCLLIATAFAGAFVASDLSRSLGVLFVMAMGALIASLSVFLREIFLAVSGPRSAIR